MRLLSASTKRPPRAARDVRLRGGWLLLARTVWVALAILAVALFLASIPGSFARLGEPDATLRASLAQHGISTGVYALGKLGADVAVALGFCAVGTLIFWRKSDEWLALLVALMLVLFGAQFNTDALLAALPGWGVPITFLGMLGWALLGLFLFTFPDGRFVPPWTIVPALVWAFGELPVLFLPSWPLSGPTPVGHVVSLILWTSALFAQIYRYRRVSTPIERQQTKWLVFGFAAAFVAELLLIVPALAVPALMQPTSLYQLLLDSITKLVFLSIPLAVGVAVLRYRLWEIDPIINRSLVYGGLRASVILIYVLIVGYLGTVFRTGGNLVIPLIATGIVAVIFQPLRERLQRAINRLMYGERDDPYIVLTRLGQRLEGTLAPDAILSTIVRRSMCIPAFTQPRSS